MTDESTRREREALIAGDRAGALEPNETAELALFADLLADSSTWAAPDAALEDAVVRAVAEADSEAEAELVAFATPPPVRERASRRRRITYSVLAVAAAVAIVLGAVAVVRSGTKRDFTAELSGGPLAPGAHASADIERNAAGFRIRLDAAGLPSLQPSEFYQAWLKNDAGTLVPIGSFSSSDASITLWSGVSPSDFPTMTVTIESTDNDQTSSGRRVLAGPVTPT
jgi:Anti-sigma-K factor rskA, C-terminal